MEEGFIDILQKQVCISASSILTVGLKTDGTVVAVGNNDKGQCNVSGWRDIVAVAAGVDRTVGLKADGTVVAVGNNEKGQCNVSGWRDIGPVSETARKAKSEQDVKAAKEKAEREAKEAEAARKAKAEQVAKLIIISKYEPTIILENELLKTC